VYVYECCFRRLKLGFMLKMKALGLKSLSFEDGKPYFGFHIVLDQVDLLLFKVLRLFTFEMLDVKCFGL
jgi:hypothetical protein